MTEYYCQLCGRNREELYQMEGRCVQCHNSPQLTFRERRDDVDYWYQQWKDVCRMAQEFQAELEDYKATLIGIHCGNLSRDEMDLAAEKVLTEWERERGDDAGSYKAALRLIRDGYDDPVALAKAVLNDG